MLLSVCPDQAAYAHSPLAGEPARWRVRPYDGGPYEYGSSRFCSFCGSLHPDDAIELIRHGGLLETTTKGYKRYVRAPNPIAGQMVRFGSTSGPVFRVRPRRWWSRLTERGSNLVKSDATWRERLRGRYCRPIVGAAPTTLQMKLYMVHVTPEQYTRMVELGRQ